MLSKTNIPQQLSIPYSGSYKQHVFPFSKLKCGIFVNMHFYAI